MQSLGRVPNARRVPVNLPSLKSEHSGSDTPVSLVPSGGPGWGNKDATSTSTTTPSTVSFTDLNHSILKILNCDIYIFLYLYFIVSKII